MRQAALTLPLCLCISCSAHTPSTPLEVIQLLRQAREPSSAGGLSALAFLTPRNLFYAGYGGMVGVFDADSQRTLWERPSYGSQDFSEPNAVAGGECHSGFALAVSPDAKLIAVGDNDRIRVLFTADGRRVAEFRDERTDSKPFTQLLFVSGGELLVGKTSGESTLHIWDVETHRALPSLAMSPAPGQENGFVFHFAFDERRQLLWTFTAFLDNQTLIGTPWRLGEHQHEKLSEVNFRLPETLSFSTSSFSFLPSNDGAWAAVQGYSQSSPHIPTALVYSLDTGRLEAEQPEMLLTEGARFAEGSTRLLAASRLGFQTWDFLTGQLVRTEALPCDAGGRFLFSGKGFSVSPDGHRMACLEGASPRFGKLGFSIFQAETR